MKKPKMTAMAVMLLTVAGCVYYPARPVAYYYPVDPNQPPPVVYVPSYDPYYSPYYSPYYAPYPYGSIFSFNWSGGGGGKNQQPCYNQQSQQWHGQQQWHSGQQPGHDQHQSHGSAQGTQP